MTLDLRLALTDREHVLRATYVVAGIGMVLSIVAAGTLSGYLAQGVLVVLMGPFCAIAGALAPRARAEVFTVGVAVSAVFSGGSVFLYGVLGTLVLLAVAADRRPLPILGWGVGLAGVVIQPYVSGYLLVALAAVVIGGGLGQLVRAQLRAITLVQDSHALKEQTRWLEQRTELARELHDVVGHHVTAMVVQAEAGLVSESQQALSTIGELGRTALAELDALVVHLRDPEATAVMAAPPRLSDIDELLARPLRSQGVEVDVRVSDDLELDDVQTLTAYRIVQEALTNVARHAQAHQVGIEVRSDGRHVRVRVTDDGVGTPVQVQRGSGLIGIDERVRALGGFWEIGTRLGGGTIVDVVLPMAS